MKPNADKPANDAAWAARLDRALAHKAPVAVPDSFALRVAQAAAREPQQRSVLQPSHSQRRQPRFSVGLAASFAGLLLLLLLMTLTAQPRISVWSMLNQSLYLAEFLLLMLGLAHFRELLD